MRSPIPRKTRRSSGATASVASISTRRRSSGAATGEATRCVRAARRRSRGPGCEADGARSLGRDERPASAQGVDDVQVGAVDAEVDRRLLVVSVDLGRQPPHRGSHLGAERVRDPQHGHPSTTRRYAQPAADPRPGKCRPRCLDRSLGHPPRLASLRDRLDHANQHHRATVIRPAARFEVVHVRTGLAVRTAGVRHRAPCAHARCAGLSSYGARSTARISPPCDAIQRRVRSARARPPSRHIRPNVSCPLATAAPTTR